MSASLKDKDINSFRSLGFSGGVDSVEEFARVVLGLSDLNVGGMTVTQVLGDWPLLAVGNYVEQSAFTATQDDFSYCNTGGEVMRLRITFAESTHDTFVRAERVV